MGVARRSAGGAYTRWTTKNFKAIFLEGTEFGEVSPQGDIKRVLRAVDMLSLTRR